MNTQPSENRRRPLDCSKPDVKYFSVLSENKAAPYTNSHLKAAQNCYLLANSPATACCNKITALNNRHTHRSTQILKPSK